MKVKGLTAFLCACFLVFQTPGIAKNIVREQAATDLGILQHLLEVKYAPKAWKEDLFGWSLLDSTNEARARLDDMEVPTTKYCQRVLANYIAGLNDFHSGMTFFATERAHLPYIAKMSSDGRCFIVDVLTHNSEISIGDEVLEFDGLDIKAAIASMAQGRSPLSPAAQSAALRVLFSRSAALGHTVLAGSALLKIRHPNGLVRYVRVRWRYTPESIGDFSRIVNIMKEPKLQMSRHVVVPELRLKHSLFTNPMHPYFWAEMREQNKRIGVSRYNIGSKRGFLPAFGPVIWEAHLGPYYAYIFSCTAKDGTPKNIGFVRISTYAWDELEDRELGNVDSPWNNFAEIIKVFCKDTDAVIIDQTNNPGGSLLYLYSLVSMLTDYPLVTPKHRMVLTQDEVSAAVDWRDLLDDVEDDRQAQLVLGDDMEGYHVDMAAVRHLLSFSDKVLSSWASGNIHLSEPIALLGIEEVQPHPTVRYTKPICILTNEEDFSCGDLFPAIMKDNNRALVVGTTTAGAGGCVFHVDFPNRTGIKSCSLTGSLAVREDGSLIENVGVAPHFEVPMTSLDIQSGRYSDYIERVKCLVLEFIESMDKN